MYIVQKLMPVNLGMIMPKTVEKLVNVIMTRISSNWETVNLTVFGYNVINLLSFHPLKLEV